MNSYLLVTGFFHNVYWPLDIVSFCEKVHTHIHTPALFSPRGSEGQEQRRHFTRGEVAPEPPAASSQCCVCHTPTTYLGDLTCDPPGWQSLPPSFYRWEEGTEGQNNRPEATAVVDPWSRRVLHQHPCHASKAPSSQRPRRELLVSAGGLEVHPVPHMQRGITCR